VRDIIRTTLIAVGLLGCSHTTTLSGLGPIDAAQICPDVKRCDARGDRAFSTIRGTLFRKARPIYLAEGQGPESYLGKVAPKRKAQSVLMTCGGDIGKDDWYETAPVLRTIELTEAGKRELRTALRTHFAQELNERPKVLEGTDATPEAAVEAASMWLNVKKVGLVSQTYWLKDAAFERRVAQCGEEEYGNIIYSMTIVRLSDLMHKELEARLLDGLEPRLSGEPVAEAAEAESEPLAEAAEPSEDSAQASEQAAPVPAQEAPASTAEADARAREDARYALMQELAYRAVHKFAAELHAITAFGYDEQ
jgi:hypothetical protein